MALAAKYVPTHGTAGAILEMHGTPNQTVHRPKAPRATKDQMKTTEEIDTVFQDVHRRLPKYVLPSDVTLCPAARLRRAAARVVQP